MTVAFPNLRVSLSDKNIAESVDEENNDSCEDDFRLHFVFLKLQNSNTKVMNEESQANQSPYFT
jgi:hypothetical protein